MSETELAALAMRLPRAERRAALLSTLGAASLIAALIITAARPSESGPKGSTLRAPFRVVDGAGRPCLEVDVADRAPRLRLLTRDGSSAVEVSSTTEGGYISVRHSEGTTVLQTRATRQGGYLAINGRGGLTVGIGTAVGLNDRVRSHAVFSDGVQICEVGADPDGAGLEVAWSEQRGGGGGHRHYQSVASIGAARDGAGAITLHNREGKRIWSAPEQKAPPARSAGEAELPR